MADRLTRKRIIRLFVTRREKSPVRKTRALFRAVCSLSLVAQRTDADMEMDNDGIAR